MSIHECGSCKAVYKKDTNKPIILSCGDTICSSCISFYRSAENKNKFDCPICCNIAESKNIENKGLYPKGNISNAPSSNFAPVEGEFEVNIKLLNNERITIRVTKEMTIETLKNKIAEEKGINKKNLFLTFRKPLNNKKTLEFYGIKKEVTIMQTTNEFGGLL